MYARLYCTLLLNPAPLQTSLQASYTTHTNFSPARDRFRRALSVEGLDQRRWGNGGGDGRLGEWCGGDGRLGEWSGDVGGWVNGLERWEVGLVV